MTKRKRDRRRNDKIDPNSPMVKAAAAAVFTAEEFTQIVERCSAAAVGEVEMITPPLERSIRFSDEPEKSYSFADTPQNRFMFSAVDYFHQTAPGDDGKYFGFMFRYDAMVEMLSDPRAQRWIVDGRGSFEGLADAAVTVPLHGMTFNADEYFAAVEAVYASGKYSYTGETW